MYNELIYCKQFMLSLACVDIEENIDKSLLNKYFNETELDCISSYKFKKRRYEYIYGRIACKNSISKFTKINDYKRIHIRNGCFNQPIVSIDDISINISISLSHSDKKALAITFLSDFPCGVDIEEIKEDNSNLIYGILTNNEREIINEETTKSKIETLTTLWTAKEAVSKALMVGFTSGFEILEINKFNLHNNCINGDYKVLNQYQYKSKKIDNNMITIAYPKI